MLPFAQRLRSRYSFSFFLLYLFFLLNALCFCQFLRLSFGRDSCRFLLLLNPLGFGKSLSLGFSCFLCLSFFLCLSYCLLESLFFCKSPRLGRLHFDKLLLSNSQGLRLSFSFGFFLSSFLFLLNALSFRLSLSSDSCSLLLLFDPFCFSLSKSLSFYLSSNSSRFLLLFNPFSFSFSKSLSFRFCFSLSLCLSFCLRLCHPLMSVSHHLFSHILHLPLNFCRPFCCLLFLLQSFSPSFFLSLLLCSNSCLPLFFLSDVFFLLESLCFHLSL